MSQKRKCKNCGILFRPNKNNAYHQHYCTKSECKQASAKASKRKYRKRKSRDQAFKIRESERVKKYQRENPDYYKKRKKSSKKVSDSTVLRDFAQVEKCHDDISVLRDFVIFQHVVIEGVISTFADDVLRDNISIIQNRFYDKGKSILGDVSEIGILTNFRKRFCNEKQSVT